MTDGVIKGTGNSRYLKSVADFLTLYPDYQSFAQALVAGTLPIDLNGINSSGWSTVGTKLNKSTLLADSTASKFGLGNSATVNDAFNIIEENIGFRLLKEYTSPGSYTYTFDGEYELYVLIIGAGGGGQGGGKGYNNTDAPGGGGGGGGAILAHIISTNLFPSRAIVVGAAGSAGSGRLPTTENSSQYGYAGGNGGASSCFGITALGGEGGGATRFDDGGKGGDGISNGGDGLGTDSDPNGIVGNVFIEFGNKSYTAGGGGGSRFPTESPGYGGVTTSGYKGGDGGRGADATTAATNGTAGGRGCGGGGGGSALPGNTPAKGGNGSAGGPGYVAIYGRRIGS